MHLRQISSVLIAFGDFICVQPVIWYIVTISLRSGKEQSVRSSDVYDYIDLLTKRKCWMDHGIWNYNLVCVHISMYYDISLNNSNVKHLHIDSELYGV